jgi:hypothetical protein
LDLADKHPRKHFAGFERLYSQLAIRQVRRSWLGGPFSIDESGTQGLQGRKEVGHRKESGMENEGKAMNAEKGNAGGW